MVGEEIVGEAEPGLYEELMRLEALDEKPDQLRFQPEERVHEVHLDHHSCITMCTKIYKPVCGDDNEEYPNECEMLNANCR